MDTDHIPRPDPAVVERLRTLPTSTIANALDDVGKTVNCPVALRPMAPGIRFAGPAVTVDQETGGAGEFASADFRVGAMIDLAQAGDALHLGRQRRHAAPGRETGAPRRDHHHVAGLVVDGGVRDIDEMVDVGFPVFARHAVPTTGRTRLRLRAVNVPVAIDGVGVEPGDVMVADATGLVVVPAADAERVADLAEQFARDEQEIRDGLSFTDAMAKFTRI